MEPWVKAVFAGMAALVGIYMICSPISFLKGVEPGLIERRKKSVRVAGIFILICELFVIAMTFVL